MSKTLHQDLMMPMHMYPILNRRAHLHEGSKYPIYLGIHTYNTFKSALLCVSYN